MSRRERLDRIAAGVEPAPADVVELNRLAAEASRLAWEDTARWTERLGRAVALLEAALALDPRDAATLTNLAAAESDRGHHERAFALLQRALALGSDDANLYTNLAVVCLNLSGRRAEASKWFERAREAQARPDTWAAWFDLHGH